MQYNSEEFNEILNIFKVESEEIIQELNDNFLVLEKNTEDKAPLKKLLQLAHSLKSAARMIGFNSIQDLAHKLEDILTFWRNENEKINPDFFEEIYKICDFIIVLVNKSVEQKSNYYDEQVMIFIDKLDKFITKNNIVQTKGTKEQATFEKKTIDINATVLELTFILERENEDNFDDFLLVIKENLNQLDEAFKQSEHSNIKEKIKELINYTNIENENDFNMIIFKAKVIDLNSEIYALFKKLNIKTSPIQRTKKEKKKEEKKEQILKEEAENKTRIISKFDYVLSNLQRIKYEKNAIHLIMENLKNIIDLANNKKIELILNKTINILGLFDTKEILIDNDCYMVILQCVYLAKRLSLNEKEENLNNLNFLIQRLSVVEDMFNISDMNIKTSLDVRENENLLSSENITEIKKNIKNFDFQEIKTLRVDTVKIDNLISQTGELLINGIKTREHIFELAKINEKLVKWSGVSKKINNYLKYLEKKGFFNENIGDSAQAFYKKAQNFFNSNSEMINEINNDFNSLYNIISEDDNKLHQTVLEIETIAKGIRVLPLATIFHSFPRMIRDIAKEKNKQIDFIVSGSDTTVDKKIIEEIKMPLIHIIRNAVSHGIEAPEIRKQNGKDETGIIKLSAKQAENNVFIRIEDDGYGINLIKIKDTAIKKGLLSFEEADIMSAEQLMKLLFIPGFSTEDSVSEISGRGIGLDIVKTKISNLNGEIFIDSELNKGCIVTIKLPVSMSTIKTFIIQVNKEKYAIPLNSIKYVKQIKGSEIFNKNNDKCILFNEHSVPIYNLNEIFESEPKHIDPNEIITIIIIENQEKQVAFITEKLIGAQEIFHKKLVPPILKIKNISGFTTLSTGEICLIINPYELIRNTITNNFNLKRNKAEYLIEDKKETTNNKKILIFNNEEEFLGNIKQDLKANFNAILEFNSINSIYDFLMKNEADILICEITETSDDVIRLIKYIKSDENFNALKIVIFSSLTEFEISQKLKDYSYNLYEKNSSYNKEEFISKISEL